MKAFPLSGTAALRRGLLALGISWPLLTHAAGELPSHLTGTWGTAESLYAGPG